MSIESKYSKTKDNLHIFNRINANLSQSVFNFCSVCGQALTNKRKGFKVQIKEKLMVDILNTNESKHFACGNSDCYAPSERLINKIVSFA